MRTATSVPIETRQELCQAKVTLNGQAAKITGYGNRFATVTDKATRLSAQWSWEAVERVVASGGGAFES